MISQSTLPAAGRAGVVPLRDDQHAGERLAPGAAVYAGLFGLDPSRFSEIGSERFGYIGTLTLFDPPNRLDRIELSQVTDDVHSMGRFAQKHGNSLYMCYVEVHDWPAVRGRLLDADARYTPRGSGSGDRSRWRLGASQGTAWPAARRLAHRPCVGLVGPRGPRAAGMKRRLLVLALAGRAARRAQAQADDWQTVVGARPALPARDAGARDQEHGRREGEGPRRARVAWESKRGDQIFDFDYVDYDPGWFSSHDSKEMARDLGRGDAEKAFPKPKYKYLRDEPITLQGWDGYALDIEGEDGAGVMMRTYIAKDRLFRLLVTVDDDTASRDRRRPLPRFADASPRRASRRRRP